MSEVRYMISDAADKLQIEAHVLRYWEEELELDVPRNEMGHRYYTEEWIGTFEQIQTLKDRGYQLRAIKALIHKEGSEEPEIFFLLPEASVKSVEATEKMEQFQDMMTAIVKNALAENNLQLGHAVGEQIGEKLIKEMNYLMREREEQEEARFRKLDETLRAKQTKIKVKKVSWMEKRRSDRELKKVSKKDVLKEPRKDLLNEQ